MKKIIALLLMVLMVAGQFSTSVIAAGEETVTAKPFYMVNWDAPEGDLQYIYSMPWSWTNANKITESTDADSIKMTIGGVGCDPKTAAQKLYEALADHPAGARYFNFAAQRTMLLARCKDLVDLRHGVELTKNWLTAVLAEYKALGGVLDGILLDLEYRDSTVYYINANYYSKSNKNIYNEIAANEYYKTVMRPILVERGFVFYQNPDPALYPYRSELWTLENTSKEDGGNALSQNIWNQLIQEIKANAMTEAVYEPLIQFFPNAVVSDYKTGDSYSWLKGMDHGGGTSTLNSIKAGNASNYNFYDYGTGRIFYGYGSEENRTKRTQYKKPAGFNDAVFADAPFNRTNLEVNTFKRLLASTDTGKVNAWITFFNYGAYGPGYSRTPYYSELIYHLGMADPEPFVGYIRQADITSKGKNDPDPDVSRLDYNLKIVEDLLTELTRVAGASDRKAIVTPITWNENFFLSGMYAGGRNIWRLTPNTEEVSKADFKVKDTAPTFSVNGVTVTFPQGRIIADSPVTHVGTCGYWIETPANVTPVVTSTADRYEKDPSFSDSFDYAVGTFTTESVLPNTYWTVSGSASVVENGGNKAVSLTGNTTMTNTKVPEQITAGDYYAKQQAWEVTVTLPAGNYGEIKLLSYSDADGGFKIADGKVYFHTVSGYKELPLTLPAGTYTFRREMCFLTLDNSYTCHYSVFDAQGNFMTAAGNAVVSYTELPIANISLHTTDTANAILVDDYKLYPTGVTANLDLYDAELGRVLADPKAPQTTDTAYRLSWMNASDQHKVARIYDAQTGTILKTVEMAPGMDGVVTDIVAASADKPVQIAVNVQAGTAPAPVNYDKGDFSWTATAAENLGLAVGTKIPYTGTGDNSVITPDNEEGKNIFDVLESETAPEDTPETTPENMPDEGNKPSDEKDASGNGRVWIIALCVAMVAGGVMIYLFLIKPRLAAKRAKEQNSND